MRLMAAPVFRIEPLAPRVYGLVGEVDLEGDRHLRWAVRVEAAKPGDIVLNLQELTFVGSMGIAARLRLASRLRGELILSNPMDNVRRTLHPVGLLRRTDRGLGYKPLTFMDIVREISATEMAPSIAREALDVLTEAVPRERYDVLQLIVSELVTNCVRHAALKPDDRVLVRVRLIEAKVRIEVEDCGPGFPGGKRRNVPADAEGGRGLYIVQEVADRWGVESDGSTVVWAELSLAA